MLWRTWSAGASGSGQPAGEVPPPWFSLCLRCPDSWVRFSSSYSLSPPLAGTDENNQHAEPMTTSASILRKLKARGSRKNIGGMARFGISTRGRLGVSMPEIRRIAKETGRDHELAITLWESGIADARIVASIVADPGSMTEAEMDRWVSGFDSWDVCDQVCMNLFQEVPCAKRKIREWSRREEEFVRRAAYALIACLAWHDTEAPDTVFTGFLQLIRRDATDERNFVKKAVNWALRNIGKRNPRLNKAAIRTARDLSHLDSKSARWIGADALRELTSAAVQRRIRRVS
jgi:3-methyladenine DNA glycosylase AlkD